MRDTNRIGCCLAVTLCLAGTALAQGAGDLAAPRAVAPEPTVAPSQAGETTPPPGETPPPKAPLPVLEEFAPMPPVVVSSAHSPAGCSPQQACCPGGTCGGCWRCFRSRVKSCLQASHWGYPEEFCELPLGARLYAHLNTQVANGTAAQMVLYRYDFSDGILNVASQLNQHGRMRLKHLAWMLQANVYPLVVEHTPEEPRLAAARRDHVLKSLEELGFAVPEEWVIVGEPRAAGLSGEEALTVHQRMLPQQGRQPSPSTGGGTLTRGASTMLQESSQTPSFSATGGGA